MTHPKTPPRLITPRRIALATVAGMAVTQPQAFANSFATKAFAAGAEQGEAGEAGVELSEGPAQFLTKLGYFEGTYRIAAALYLEGEHKAAAAHLEESHHAFYEDIAPALAEYKAPGFAAEAEAFTAAIMTDAGDDAVSTAYLALMTAVGASAASAGASHYDKLMSLHDLMSLAAAEYDGGVSDGAVELAIEYRDSWGFYETARARAEGFTGSDDLVLVKSGAAVLAQLDGIEALYPSLTSESGSKDPSQLTVAAGWIEIIALRTK